jgi:fatty-acyl-CoA synthase
MSRISSYELDLDRNPANFTALTPLTWVERAARVFGDRIALIHGEQQWTWKQTWERSRRLASALQKRGVGRLDTVAILAPNSPPMIEGHYGVPLIGAVLNSINTRLDSEIIAFILEHGEAKVFIVDRELSEVAKKALALTQHKPLVIHVDDPLAEGGELIGELSYDELLAEGDPDFQWTPPEDEWQAIALNYTSGTTGNPKGVVLHHRGAYLNAMGNIPVWDYPTQSVYLWTLPLFHCNGWCFPWTNALVGATNVTIRKVSAVTIFDAIERHKVTHFCAAPIVLAMVAHAKDDERRPFDHQVNIMTASAPPRLAVFKRMEELGFRITHVYGLTEVFGAAVHCAWHRQWDGEDIEERVRLKGRQGVNYPVIEGLIVADPKTLEPVPADGQTIGEVLMRGNAVMKGYLKNPRGTAEAFAGGWFHTGDLGVQHPDGYIELRDRSKDIIISGGENISSLEVESVLLRHPGIDDVAVVARPDEKWDELPCAFVVVHAAEVPPTEADIIAFARAGLAHFKAPHSVVFVEALPRNAFNKVDKKALREVARNL